MSDKPRVLKKSGWHEDLEEILRTEIANEAARGRALKALECTVEEKNAIILGLLTTLESHTGTGQTPADPDRTR